MTPIDVQDRKQLLFDHRFLAECDGVEHCVNIPRKTNEKLLVAERPWEEAFVGPYCTVMEDEGVYRMWYESYYRDADGKLLGVLCYAESSDAIQWHKPSVKLIEVKGTLDNNVVFPPPGRVYHGGTVFKDPTAPAKERYKLFYYENPSGVRGAYSADGFSWTIYPGAALLRYQCDTQNVCFWDASRKKFVAYIRLNRPVRDSNRIRTIGRSETTDFLNWPGAKVVMSYDDNDPSDVDLYNSAAIQYPHAQDSYFIIASLFHQSQDALEPQLAVSRDGVTWSRPLRKAFISLGDEGSFDSKMIHTCVGQFRRRDEWLTFYRGTSSVHTSHGNRSTEKFNGTISRVISRPDGFVSLDAEKSGTFLTPPMLARGSRLQLNSQSSGEGHIRVELCDEHGRAIEGFRAGQCQGISGDQLAGDVVWQYRQSLSEIIARPFRMRIFLERAKLYAFQFASNGGPHA
jgi:hypothetical protein